MKPKYQIEIQLGLEEGLEEKFKANKMILKGFN
jgi:hypothetical protein